MGKVKQHYGKLLMGLLALGLLVALVPWASSIKVLKVFWGQKKALILTPWGVKWVDLSKVQTVNADDRYDLGLTTIAFGTELYSSILYLRDEKLNTVQTVIIDFGDSSVRDAGTDPINVHTTEPEGELRVRR